MKKSESQNDWNRTMFLCSNFADFWAWSVVLCFFSYTNTLAFVSPRIYCIWIVLDYVRSVRNQQFIHRSTQCFIDGQEKNKGNLALGFEQCVNKCRQRYGFPFFVWFKCSEQQLCFVYEVWTSSIIPRPTTCPMCKAVYLKKKWYNCCKCLTCKTSYLF